MQIKEGKKEYIQIKFIANLRGKKPAKLGLIANLAQLKNVTNKQNGKIKTMPGLYEKQGAVYVKNK